jgi:2-keto-3-deoxy-L-rhamnonate aldolase RhmA
VKPNSAKVSLDAKKKLLGCWLQLFSPVVGEMMGLCGYDLVLIDMEHGLGSVVDAANVMRAVRGTGASSFIRVPTNDATIIKTLMDQGVDGIMVPMVETPEAALSAVRACQYPPKGVRGMAIGIARGADYGMQDAQSYVETVDDQMVVICQIETVAAVRRAKEIAEVDGVDMLFIGRNDLAADSGHILDLDHPEVDAMTAEVVAIAHAAGRTVGTVPSAGRHWRQLLVDGFDLVIPSSDISILRAFGQEEVAAFSAATAQGKRLATVAKGY